MPRTEGRRLSRVRTGDLQELQGDGTPWDRESERT